MLNIDEHAIDHEAKRLTEFIFRHCSAIKKRELFSAIRRALMEQAEVAYRR
jgi:hypothetical protein